jgi:hypothetical protein
LEEREDGIYICSTSPTLTAEKINKDNASELLRRLRNSSNWTVPW